MAPRQLSILRKISLSDVEHLESVPTLKIHTDKDVETWRGTRGYQEYGLFLRRLSESVVGHDLPWSNRSPSKVRMCSNQ
jgi:serine/threonine-protein phosphatase 2A activator